MQFDIYQPPHSHPKVWQLSLVCLVTDDFLHFKTWNAIIAKNKKEVPTTSLTKDPQMWSCYLSKIYKTRMKYGIFSLEDNKTWILNMEFFTKLYGNLHRCRVICFGVWDESGEGKAWNLVR